MVKLKVLTQLKFGKDGSSREDGGPRKVRTVQQIPKILTILNAHDKEDVLKKVASGIGMQEVIDEERRDEDSGSSEDESNHKEDK